MLPLPKPEMNVKVRRSIAVDSSSIKCFSETPRKTGLEKPLSRIGAFDLFTLFTADIIRQNVVFTR